MFPIPNKHVAAIVPSGCLLVGITLVSLAETATNGDSWLSQNRAVVFIKGDVLTVNIVVVPTTVNAVSGTLRVALINGKGGVAFLQEKKLEGIKQPKIFEFSFKEKRVARSPDSYTLRCSLHFAQGQALNDESWERNLSELTFKRHDTYVMAQDEYTAGSIASMRVAVMGVRSLAESVPFPGSKVEIILKGEKLETISLFRGETDLNGTIEPKLHIPDLPDGKYTVVVKTSSPIGDDEVKKEIKIKKDVKVLLVTDKPLYQPNQVIQMRALALQEINLRPVVGSELIFEILDGKGNKVFKKMEKTSDYGIASARFRLADEVNMGTYRISATIGNYKSEKTVEVKKYVLPKFKVNILTEKKYFLPKEVIKGHLEVDYFFGKPVAGGDVTIKASTFDVAFREFALLKDLKTDAKGRCEFEIKLPDYFVGQPLEKGDALVKLDVAVKDKAEHVEKATRSFNVSNQPIRAAAIPESGKLIPDVENILFVVATYPDGAPVEGADLTLEIKGSGKGKTLFTQKAKTGAGGAAKFRVTPKKGWMRPGKWVMERQTFPQGNDFIGQRRSQALVVDAVIKVKDKQGASATIKQEIGSEPLGDQILLRLNKSIYSAGESLVTEVFTTSDVGSVYIDINKNRQTLLTKCIEISRGYGKATIELGTEVFGTLEMHAYKILASGDIMRDSKVIYVHPASDLKLKVEPSKELYRPGEENVSLRFLVTDKRGNGVPAALGLIIVDESVYAIQEMQPGLEKVYFTLEKELAEPKHEICDMPWRVEQLVKSEKLGKAREEAANILLAKAEPLTEYHWYYNPAAVRMREASQNLWRIHNALTRYISEGKRFAALNKDTGKWDFRDDLLERLVKERKLEPKNIANPLVKGKNLTMADLASMEKSFSYKEWSSASLSLKKSRIWQALSSYARDHQVVEPVGGGKWRYRDGLLSEMIKRRALKKSDIQTAEGAEITLEELGSRSDVSSLNSKEELGTKEKAFAPSNIAKLVLTVRKQAIFSQIINRVSRKDISSAIYSYDKKTKSWKYKDGAIRRLGLSEVVLRAPDGRRFSLEELSKSDKAFAPDNLIMITMSQKLQAIYSQGVCPYLHSGKGRRKYKKGNRWQLPEDILKEIAIATRLRRENITDPWGHTMRLEAREKPRGYNWGCGIGRQFRVVSSGPDGKFGTEDDWYEPDTPAVYVSYSSEPGLVYYAANDWNRLAGGYGGNRLFMRARARFGKREFAGAMAMDKLAVMEEARAVPEVMMAMGAPAKRAAVGSEVSEEEVPGAPRKPARIREYFPETLLFEPSLITDDNGIAVLKIPQIADSITTWRLTASANSKQGLLGSISSSLRVFQDFFVDIDLPVSLTQNDEVSIPVAVYNYLSVPQDVTLRLEMDDWFELLGDDTKTLNLQKNEVTVVYFPIRAKKIGYQKLLVRAEGTKLSDAIRRTIEIVPDGKRFEMVINDRLTGNAAQQIIIPENSVPDSYKIIAKVYPGVFSTIMEGVEGMLRLPGG